MMHMLMFCGLSPFLSLLLMVVSSLRSGQHRTAKGLFLNLSTRLLQR